MAGSATQRRRLALLVLVAVAGHRGISRDRLMGILWPESEPAKARQVLTQWLHLIRRDLGDAAVLVGTADLRLDPKHLSSDIAELQDALDAGDHDRAATLYAGNFLEGFYVGGAPEFERWAEEQRASLVSRMRGIYEALVRSATSTADRRGAVRWAERFAALDPLDARAALAYMNALAAAGQRERAIRHARLHAELVRSQLEIEPDPGVQALAERLRTAPDTPPPFAAPQSTVAHDRDARESASVARRRPIAAPNRLWSGRRIGAIAASVLILLATSTVAFRGRARAVDSDLVVVFPFRVASGDPSLLFLREGMLDLLAAAFTGEGGPRARDARTVLRDWRLVAADSSDPSEETLLRLARSSGAGSIVVGSVVGSRDQLVFNARLLNTGNGAVLASVSQRGPADSIPILVDRLAIGLLAERARERARHSTMLADASVAVWRAYLAGQSAYRVGRYAEARQRYEAALALDSTFYPAAFGLAFAAQWMQDARAQARATQLAGNQRHRMNAYDLAMLAPWEADYSARHRLLAWQRASELFADNPDVWYELGDQLFHDGARVGADGFLERSHATFSRAIALDSAFGPALEHMVDIAVLDGNLEQARYWARRYLSLDARADHADYVKWRLATAERDEPALAALRARFDSLHPQNLHRIIGTAQIDAVGLEDARRAALSLLRRATSDGERGNAMDRLATLALNRGRIAELDSLRTRPFGPHHELYAPVWFGADTTHVASALEAYARRLSARAPSDTTDALPRYASTCFITLYHVVVGDRRRALETLNDLEALVPVARRTGVAAVIPDRGAYCPTAARTWLALADGEPGARESVERFDAWVTQAPGERPMIMIAMYNGSLWELAGEPKRALAAFQRRAYHWRNGDFYLAPALKKEGEMAARVGEHETAIRAYRKYVALRADADPPLQPEVERVRREIARLETLVGR